MSSISQLAVVWPPAAGGSVRIYGDEFCIDSSAGVLKRAYAVGTSVAVICECNRKPLQATVLFQDEDLAQQVADLFMQHQGERLEDLGKLEMCLAMIS